MRRSRLRRSLVFSVAAHLALLAALLLFRTRNQAPDPRDGLAIELDLIDGRRAGVPPFAPEAAGPEVAPAEVPESLVMQIPDPPHRKPVRRSGRGEVPPRRDREATAAAPTPSGPAPSGPTPEGPAPEGARPKDRLWSFGPRAPDLKLRDPGGLAKVTPGLHNPVPNVIRNPATNKDVLATTMGRGGVSMQTDHEGNIRGFKPPSHKITPSINLHNGMISVSGILDLTDGFSRMAGIDPYRYEKQRLAESTREQRICTMIEADRRKQRQLLFQLKQRLEGIASAMTVSPIDKRRTLFSLWDECLDGAGTDGFDIGAAARQTIIAFIRRRFPQGSKDAFTPPELAMLNRRRSSRRPFDPYTGTPAIN